jgi:hypothetical protein
MPGPGPLHDLQQNHHGRQGGPECCNGLASASPFGRAHGHSTRPGLVRQWIASRHCVSAVALPAYTAAASNSCRVAGVTPQRMDSGIGWSLGWSAGDGAGTVVTFGTGLRLLAIGWGENSSRTHTIRHNKDTTGHQTDGI